jgi:pimeloyl-ACP methyl ester carboxylesterase
LFLVLLVGLAWLLGSKAKARLIAKYPPPGQMVDIGGCRLHIQCQGEGRPGAPTVVLETPNGESGLIWAAVQPEVAKFTRVCAYDRAGLGWSDKSPNPRTVANITDDLATLLERAGVKPPYVLVGNSIGGLYARYYAHRHPDQVVGMVLVDSTHEEQTARFPAALQRMQQQSQQMMVFGMRLFGKLNAIGLLALLAEGGRIAWPMPLPANVREAYMGLACSGSKSFEAIADETAAVEANLATVAATKITTLGDIPLVVLAAGQSPISAGRGISAADVEQFNALAPQLQAELAALSPRGKLVVAENSGHYIQVDQPELVVAAIREVVEAARR